MPELTSLSAAVASTCTTMNANIPVYGSGAWTQDSGPSTAVFTNVNDAQTQVCNLIPGAYKFFWTIGNGVCDSTRDFVMVYVNSAATAYAGPDDTICGGTDIYWQIQLHRIM